MVEQLVLDKLTYIFSNYKCFNNKGYSGMKKKDRYVSHSKPVKKKERSNDVIRITIGWMNKINKTNFDTVSSNIMEYTHENNIESVVNAILNSVTSNAMNTFLLVKLLKLISVTTNQDIHYILEKYIDDINECVTNIFMVCNIDVTDYDMYCYSVKYRQNIIQKLIFCIHLKKLFSSIKPNFDMLKNTFEQMINTTDSNEIIDALFDIVMQTKIISTNDLHHLYIKNNLEHVLCKRLKLLLDF